MKKEKIKIVGIGEYGINAINKIVEEEVKDVELWCMDLKESTLENSKCHNKLVITPNCDEQIISIINDTGLVFVLADINDDNYRNALFNITKLSKENNVKKQLNLISPLKNHKAMDFLPYLDGSSSFFLSSGLESNLITEIVYTIINAIISGLNSKSGITSLDFDNIQKLFDNCSFFCALGRATGENKAEKAVKIALGENKKQISSDNVYLNISGSEDLTLSEISKAVSCLNEYISEDTKLITAATIDNQMGDDVQVVVIL